MWASGVVKGQISTDANSGLRHAFVGVEVDFFIFDRTPEPLDEDIVPPRALAVHMKLQWQVSSSLPHQLSGRHTFVQAILY